MGILNRQKNYKKCPYCKSKNPLAARYCGACHLDFDQLGRCTNKEAKKMLRHRRFGETFEGEIVYTSNLPYDVSRAKLITFCFLFGLTGGHNFYVGRYFKAIMQCILGILFLGFTTVVSILLDMPSITVVFLGKTVSLTNAISFVSLLLGIYPVVSWFFDMVAVLFKKYEVPIALEKPVDIPDEEDF